MIRVWITVTFGQEKTNVATVWVHLLNTISYFQKEKKLERMTIGHKKFSQIIMMVSNFKKTKKELLFFLTLKCTKNGTNKSKGIE